MSFAAFHLSKAPSGTVKRFSAGINAANHNRGDGGVRVNVCPQTCTGNGTLHDLYKDGGGQVLSGRRLESFYVAVKPSVTA